MIVTTGGVRRRCLHIRLRQRPRPRHGGPSMAMAVPVQRESGLVMRRSDTRDENVNLAGCCRDSGTDEWVAQREGRRRKRADHPDRQSSVAHRSGATGCGGGRLDLRVGTVRGGPGRHAIPAEAEAEAEQVFTNLARSWRRRPTLATSVRVGIVMRDLQRDRPVFNQVWARAVRRPPAVAFGDRSLGFRAPGENARFMIEVTAYRG